MEGSGAWDGMARDVGERFLPDPRFPMVGDSAPAELGRRLRWRCGRLGAATHLAQERGLPTYNRQERLGRFPQSRR